MSTWNGLSTLNFFVMSTENPNYNVGGTAKDGGLSTADTVADGGPDSKQEDPSYAGDDGSKYEGYIHPSYTCNEDYKA